jgi:hypothetical protein
MPSGPADIGIQSASATLLQSIEYEISLSEKVRKDLLGKFAVGKAFDPQITGSLTILGTSDTALGVAAAGIDGIEDGVTVFTEKNHTQVNEDYDETQLSFENSPGAAEGAAT